MEYQSLHDYLMAKPCTACNYQPDWRWHRYYVGDKLYAVLCMDEADALWGVTMKLPPEEGELLRAQHPEVIPGYYMNKQHWNTVRTDAPVSDQLLYTMLEHAYRQAFQSLSKKKQQAILNE